MQWLRRFFAFVRLALCVGSPSLFRAASMSWRILSVEVPRCWARCGLCQLLFRQWPVTIDPVCDLPQPLTSFIFLRWSIHSRQGQTPCFSRGTICRLTPFPHSVSFQGLSFSQSGGDVSGSILATQTVVSRSSGAAGGGSVPPAYAEGSTQTTPLSSFSSEPPCYSIDWLSYCE